MNRKEKTILFIMPRLPFPANSGRKTSLYHYCRILSCELGYRLVVAAFTEYGDNENLKPSFIDRLVILPKASFIQRMKNIMINSLILRNQPMQVSLYWSKYAKKIVNELVKEENPSIVIGDMIRSTEYIKDINALRIADLDDRISLRYERQLENDIENINPYGAFLKVIPRMIQKIMLFKPLKILVIKNEIALLKRYELEISRVCDKTIFVAQREANELNHELGGDKAVAIPIGVDIDYFSYRETGSQGNNIGFLGAMSVAHNESAVRYFVSDIMPLILKSVPNAKFMIIGGGASDELKQMENDYIKFTGCVDDVRDYLQECKVFVCPMTFGSGIKTKNLEAMSLGLPVVTTSIGAENIDAKDGRDWLISDDSCKFAENVVTLLCDEDKRKQVGQNGSKYIQKKWTWNVTKQAFESLLGVE